MRRKFFVLTHDDRFNASVRFSKYLSYSNLRILKDFYTSLYVNVYKDHTLNSFSIEELHVLLVSEFCYYLLEALTEIRGSYNFLSFKLSMRKIVMTKFNRNCRFLSYLKDVLD